ncbi:MAG: ABC transporter ATP-binding protein [bacterium JZ-2024 1]
MIRLADIYKTYRLGKVSVPALRGVSLSVEPGEFVAIMGPSGCGKSTLLNIMGCLDTPTKGEYWLKGRNVSRLTDNQLSEIRSQEIGFVFQQYNLLARLTVLENVLVPTLYRTHLNSVKYRERAVELLKMVGLGDRLRHKPNEISGGQQQKVAIARAMIMNPSILLADEPTGNLDSASGLDVMALIRRLNEEQGVTVILVTHEQDIAGFARRLVRLKDGKVVLDQPTKSGAELTVHG